MDDRATYWEEQLKDIDFTALGEGVMVKESSPTMSSRARRKLVLALLVQVLEQLQLNPNMPIDGAVILFTLPGGATNAVFPTAYNLEQLQRLAEAADNFSQSVSESGGERKDVWR